MPFPERRMRRLRRTPVLRRMVAETRLSPDDLIAPLFVREGIDEPQPIVSLPGVVQHTRDSLRKEARRLSSLGVPAVVLFGVPLGKDAEGSQAWDPDGIVQVALADLKDDLGDSMVLIADLCLDEYTDHGHCGILDERGDVDNDLTIERYGRVAVAQAAAGADAITFTSSSTVTNYLAVAGAAAVPPFVACIGPITAGTARAAGLKVDVVAGEHSIEGLITALRKGLAATGPARR